ncbi:MAG TPA: bifunctional 5,10-methylenetetrahydrofolate dehydrogenase/5,10-methenyltetrahydrofolate cyclohydrolase [Syntrophomonas sp.]|nr:bifunctional 5,10-methylenetetrahydrofolate dehydrogenase/5,10-methenyltetrahydrofolate cyclohydrolase [Syntrophomonas sp.]HRW11633.1 bifunctional 5,10-methylenetetrahydrofolate dehydrogenase/5,10-methenyltetrahydrofolate cyclohydrolase [Syntrophomonas sp.]
MLIYGHEIRAQLKQQLINRIGSRKIAMAVVQVGEQPDADAYINGIKRFGNELGVDVAVIKFSEDISEEKLLIELKQLNQDERYNGIMLQKPFPPQLRDEVIVNAMNPDKDVEGIHNFNLGKIINRENGIRPATPKAVIRMLKDHNVDLEGARVTIVGRSSILGSPLALMMMAENATVTVCHTRTRDLAEEIKRADIVVAAMGQLNFIKAEMIRKETIIIDAGINFDAAGNMFGDVDEQARSKARMASAVPGGVGLVTVAELFDNLCLLQEI